jgi:hypothetical protein
MECIFALPSLRIFEWCAMARFVMARFVMARSPTYVQENFTMT